MRPNDMKGLMAAAQTRQREVRAPIIWVMVIGQFRNKR
jgi:hypothetical protein